MSHYTDELPSEHKLLFRFTPEHSPGDYYDIPDEYAICELPDYPVKGETGVIVFGRCEFGWYPNANARPVISYLLREAEVFRKMKS